MDLNKIDLTDTYRAFRSSAQEHTEHSPGDYMLGHKTSLNKLRKIEILPSIFSDHDKNETRNQ